MYIKNTSTEKMNGQQIQVPKESSFDESEIKLK